MLSLEASSMIHLEQPVSPLKSALRFCSTAIALPYVRRELPGWGKVYSLIVGDYRRDWLWEGTAPRSIRGKLHGFLMTLDLARWPDRSTYFLGRWYDLEAQALLNAMVRPGDTVVDVGANRGMFALSAASAVGERGRVVCFEPNPTCASLLRRELAQNGIRHAEVRELALGREQARLTLSIPTINSGEATLGPSQYESVELVEVAVEVGDKELAGLMPAMIKIDVEGFECPAIDGLRETIARSRPVILTEVVAEHLERCGSSCDDLFARMAGLGYTGFVAVARRDGIGLSLRLQRPPADRAMFDAVWLPNERLPAYAEHVQQS